MPPLTIARTTHTATTDYYYWLLASTTTDIHLSTQQSNSKRMGLLSLGTPLEWNEAKKYADHVRENGINQFLNIWNRVKTRKKDRLLWGDEVEYCVVSVDSNLKTAHLSLKAYETLIQLEDLEMKSIRSIGVFDSSWKPEYGRYMMEGTPGTPYGGRLEDLLRVESNMKKRRELGQSLLSSGEHLITLTNYPHLGVGDFFYPDISEATPVDGISQSFFIPDVAINPHARFGTLTANIRKRRDSKVAINVPIFKDLNTPSPFKEVLPPSIAKLDHQDRKLVQRWSNSTLPNESPKTGSQDKLTDVEYLQDLIVDAKPDHIYMDAMCFGMGCCCLQITFQACSVEEARKLYDHLAVLSPIMLALSAAAPIFRGYLADVDCRWSVISGSVDDRSKEERGVAPLKENKFRIPKSRYDSISAYLSPGPLYSGGCCGVRVETNGTDPSTGKILGDYYKDEYNDIDLVYDKDIYDKLVSEGLSLFIHLLHFVSYSNPPVHLITKEWTIYLQNIMLTCSFVILWSFLKSSWIKTISLVQIILRFVSLYCTMISF